MSKSAATLPLADGFAPAAEADWRALVQKTLKEALRWRASSAASRAWKSRPLYSRRRAPVPTPLDRSLARGE